MGRNYVEVFDKESGGKIRKVACVGIEGKNAGTCNSRAWYIKDSRGQKMYCKTCYEELRGKKKKGFPAMGEENVQYQMPLPDQMPVPEKTDAQKKMEEFLGLQTGMSEKEFQEKLTVASEQFRKDFDARYASKNWCESLIERKINNAEDAIDEKFEELSDIANEKLDELEVIVKSSQPFQVVIPEKGVVNDAPKVRHKIFMDVCMVASAGIHQMLVGPAGSGKTTIAQQVATTLGLDFYFTGAILTKYELTGYKDGHGNYHGSVFRDAFEKGGLFLWDEIDASRADALVAFNAALENDVASFPDGNVKRHENFVCIASANTYGTGADRQYVGRTQLDAATLDRYVSVEMDYDEDLEKQLAAQFESGPVWVLEVQRLRKNARFANLRVVISPRATLKGAQLLDMGMPQEKVEKMTVFKGMDEETVKKVRGY